MSKLIDPRVVSFRGFDKIDGNTSVVYELAWPVEIIECYANKVSDGVLDALAEAVLELFTVSEMSVKRICQHLMISDEVVSSIINDLELKGYYLSEDKTVTKAGKKYLADYEVGKFLDEKVFGNMFVSKIDGEVFPYFYEGQLPWKQGNNTALRLSYNKEEIINNKDLDLVDKINRAYHRFGVINQKTREMPIDSEKIEIDFIEEELYDHSFRELEVKSMAEAEAETKMDKSIRNARVKILDTERKEAYIETRVVVSKASPAKFKIDSPFKTNVTSWYSECFNRMRENNEVIYNEEAEVVQLDSFCDQITTQFYVDYPEMQKKNFEQFIKIHFPNMISIKHAKVFLEKYEEIFNLRILCEDQQGIKRHTVVTESAKALELILNNYIANTNKSEIVSRYKSTIHSKNEISRMLMSFNIENCSAKYKELKSCGNSNTINHRQSIINLFIKERTGNTIIDKYYFLIFEASFNEQSRFRKLLLKEGTELILKFDFINTTRNKFGAHNEGTELVEISDKDYEKFQQYFMEVTRILIDYIN